MAQNGAEYEITQPTGRSLKPGSFCARHLAASERLGSHSSLDIIFKDLQFKSIAIMEEGAPMPTAIPHTPFALLTQHLLIIPTPFAIHLPSYRALYASLHADASFCSMAFGDHFPARSWDDQETYNVIHERDILRCWAARGLGDFAVGLRTALDRQNEEIIGRQLHVDSFANEVTLIEAAEFSQLLNPGNGAVLQAIEWVGYAGVRDGTTTSIPQPGPGEPDLPPWKEMIEVRYGIGSEHWGKGIAKAAAEAVMQWAVSERGVERFIAETERHNTRSAGLLQKLGFTASQTNYWQEPSEIEWERVVGLRGNTVHAG